jgi:hypothetical protein
MPPSNSYALSEAIKVRPCPKCGEPMTLARVEPHTPGYTMRTFECPSCDCSQSDVVAF